MSVIKDAQKLLDILGVKLNEIWGYFISDHDCTYVFRFTTMSSVDDIVWQCQGVSVREKWYDVTDMLDSEYIIDILTHPEHIIHTRYWLRQDYDDARAVKRLFSEAWSIERRADGCNPLILRTEPSPMYYVEVSLDIRSFPSVKCGEGPVLLDTIIDEYCNHLKPIRGGQKQ